ncbi:NAD(P)-binding oxidoreductase [Levilactobacillus acidifarinae]|uniref:NAD(P)-binding domain-containing protein n=1 Tax=Levilactobacillus acidifarinae DSM 19394 = JCM 15949 TaxID=1423715 RepID=A0A0R1LR02_9LACO|nr:NAD(P)-binding oxidoreductase [Levilactobacillus acidifarinae]KRK94530.1 hypothetical protein FD25_GL000497 [Levilactobacillus acidifarinae DSM 19394]GEO68279.1 saccharopine dehydrogenase [Levilactobacillus acidifarinae]
MNILILGATSQTGQALLHRFSQTTHHLTAFARHPERLTATPSTIQLIQGDVCDLPTLTAAMAHVDVVIAGLSGTTILTQAQNVVQAATTQHVQHLYWITGIGIHQEITGKRGALLAQYLTATPEYAQAADVIAAGPIPATLLRLPAITNGPATPVEITVEGQQPHQDTISRATLANTLVQLVTDDLTQSASLALTAQAKGAH